MGLKVNVLSGYLIELIVIKVYSVFQLTDRTEAENRGYPVVVFIHGEDYKLGDAQLYAGHILAKKEVVVVTFNYRLGALGG